MLKQMFLLVAILVINLKGILLGINGIIVGVSFPKRTMKKLRTG
jgi:hypothetical protein